MGSLGPGPHREPYLVYSGPARPIISDGPQSLDQLVQRPIPTPTPSPGTPSVFNKFSALSSTHFPRLTAPRRSPLPAVSFPKAASLASCSQLDYPDSTSWALTKSATQGGLPKSLVLALGAPHWEVGWD